jgi:hypothetical protein
MVCHAAKAAILASRSALQVGECHVLSVQRRSIPGARGWDRRYHIAYPSARTTGGAPQRRERL